MHQKTKNIKHVGKETKHMVTTLLV